ncbi:MAG: ornithine cyclodeaminase [Bacteroidaceae bacterium]|nr:ornithine cyclodeaminase [Bacteroidaceae bacterium]
MKIISEEIIRNLNISPLQCVKWIMESFSLKKDAQLPAKISVHPAPTDFFTSMPCLLPFSEKADRQYFGVKIVHRIKDAVPSLGSDLLLYDAETGELLALMDSDWITTMRTGAVAAVSAKVLRKKDAGTYGYVGLGNTARAVLLCALEAEPEKKFKVKLLKYKDQTELFIDRFCCYNNVEFEIEDDIESLTRSVDVLFSCITSANGLLIEDVDTFPAGITIIPVHTQGFQNCDTVFDRVFGDDTNHVKGFRFFHQFHDYNEIGEVLAGRDPGRKSDNQRIIDYNYGLGLHDVLYASKIYELLLEYNNNLNWVKESRKFWI